MRYTLLIGVALTAFAVQSPLAYAQATSPSTLAAIHAELAALKAQQSETAARISAIENNLRAVTSASQTPETLHTLTKIAPTPATHTTGVAQPASPLSAYADFMMRFEGNYGGPSVRDRQRGVMRARLGADYKVSDTLTVGGLLETGDPDDPNSGYVTISDFTDDLQVSLSRAYAQYSHEDFTFVGGKFAKPFASSDLLWDGDVNPMGLAASWNVKGENYALKTTGILSVIDESSAGSDSRMLGGQVKFDANPNATSNIWAAVSYYDYELDSVAGADAGDFRSNLLRADGRYLSDFDILDVLAGFTWAGISPQWPLTVKADYVKNLGAAVDADTAYQIELTAGRTKKPNDYAFHVGYGQAEVDSVFAAYSNDNFGLATNYKAYRLGVDYIPLDHVKLNASYYHYTSLDSTYATSIPAGDWRDRIRLNVILNY